VAAVSDEPRPAAGGEASDRATRIYAPTDGPFARELAQAAACFNGGDFRGVRQRCRSVTLSSGATSAERAFAGDLLRRTGIDKAALVVGAVVAAVIVLLFATTTC